MANLIALPDRRKPGSSKALNNWWVHTASINWTKPGRSHCPKFKASGKTHSASLNPYVNGTNPYTSSSGFAAKVYTSDDSYFNSIHYFGATDGLNLSDLQDGQTVNSNNQSCYLRDVTAFVCEINGIPTLDGDFGGSGESQNDNCGRTKDVIVAGVYMDPSRKTRILNFSETGSKIHSSFHTYSNWVPNSWTKFGYALSSSDGRKVVNDQLMLLGWVFRVSHKRECGGKNVNKNCVFRLRYLVPLINATGENNFSEQETGYDWQLVMPPETTATQAVAGFGLGQASLFVK